MTVSDLPRRAEADAPGTAEMYQAQHPGAAYAPKAPVHSAVLGPAQTQNVGGMIDRVFQAYAPLAYNLPWVTLEYIEMLATYNADYSQAVENIKTLANSGHNLFVKASSDLQQKRIIALLQEKAMTIQQRDGGIDGLIDKLLDQGATFGAMCGEWLLSEDLSQVVDFADVNPKQIRFFWDEVQQRYAPYQKVSTMQLAEANRNGQVVRNGCVKLNEATFHYFAFDAAPGSPYGTPPFLAALEPIGIQRDMIANMSQIVKKIGLLGIVDVIVKSMPPKPGESADDYMSRATSYLDKYAEAVQNMVQDGGLIHFDDVEVKPTSIAGNAAGATAIFKQNEELVFSGLKSMPSVQGRSYSTTETYAGVAYDIIIRNTKSYQRGCKRMIEAGYWLMCTLAGLTPTDIDLQFEENKTLNRLQQAQAEAVEIRNVITKWLIGVINQLEAAQELGYSTVDKEMDKPPPEALGEKPTGGPTTGVDPAGGGEAGQGGSGGNGNTNASARHYSDDMDDDEAYEEFG